jgi:hypothetical protein
LASQEQQHSLDQKQSIFYGNVVRLQIAAFGLVEKLYSYNRFEHDHGKKDNILLSFHWVILKRIYCKNKKTVTKEFLIPTHCSPLPLKPSLHVQKEEPIVFVQYA